MKCPLCPDSSLLMSDRQGIEIDYCPNCRGVWLDRGELDKLIELSSKQAPNNPPAFHEPRTTPQYSSGRDFKDSGFGKQHYGGYRKKSWLHDIFD